MNIQQLIDEFFAQKDTKIQIYNEISLQIELGIFLREKDFTVRFERPVQRYTNAQHSFIKKEIDIVFFKGMNDEFDKYEPNKNNEEDHGKYAIELKFPRCGQYPEQMFQFIKDIQFMEEVKYKCSFTDTYVLTLVDDDLFYTPTTNQKGIYDYFRGPKQCIPAHTNIQQPTGGKSNILRLRNCYQVKWNTLKNPLLIPNNASGQTPKYYLLQIV